MRNNKFLKRLRKKGKKGLRGWPLATIAFYGPNLSQATKAAVGIIPSENAEAEEMRAWHVLHGDIREDVEIGQEIVEFIQDHMLNCNSGLSRKIREQLHRGGDCADMY